MSVGAGAAVLTREGGSAIQGPPNLRPCLDSITAKVFYFLEHSDQRTWF